MFSIFLFLFSLFSFISGVNFMQLLLPCFQRHSSFSDNELALCIRWLNYWSFSVSPSNEYSGLISFRIHLLAVQRTLKCLLQQHSLKTSVLQFSAFFMIQLTSVPLVHMISVYIPNVISQFIPPPFTLLVSIH